MPKTLVFVFLCKINKNILSQPQLPDPIYVSFKPYQKTPFGLNSDSVVEIQKKTDGYLLVSCKSGKGNLFCCLKQLQLENLAKITIEYTQYPIIRNGHIRNTSEI
jgi:hypothetical protein